MNNRSISKSNDIKMRVLCSSTDKKIITMRQNKQTCFLFEKMQVKLAIFHVCVFFSSSGLAFIGTLCETDESLSIVEEQGGFQSIGTAAHEIGHRCLIQKISYFIPQKQLLFVNVIKYKKCEICKIQVQTTAEGD